MALSTAFTEHPKSVGETYLEHMRSALSFSFTMTRAAICCLVHGFLPFLFKKAGSNAVRRLYTSMVRNRSSQSRRHPEGTKIESDLCI